MANTFDNFADAKAYGETQTEPQYMTFDPNTDTVTVYALGARKFQVGDKVHPAMDVEGWDSNKVLTVYAIETIENPTASHHRLAARSDKGERFEGAERFFTPA